MGSILKKILLYIPGKIKKRIIREVLESLEISGKRIDVLGMMVKQTAQMTLGVDFQGQVGQDIFAYSYFCGKKEGFYIDIGAHDGKSGSNTIIFENLGWNGICVEPLPDVFEELRKNRHCDCINAAISQANGSSIEFIRASGVETLSGLRDQMTESHKRRILNENGKIEKILVKTLTFENLMSGYPEKRHIDFMSVDVEGAEMSILKTIDFKKFNFDLITVENNEETKGAGEELEKFMEKKGYKVYLDLGLDIMFVPEKNRQLAEPGFPY